MSEPVAPAATPGLAELLARPGVVEVLELRSRFGFMAFHGGALEEVTDVIAAAAASAAGASYYGVLHPDSDHHLASARFEREQSAVLDAFLGHVDVVVALHGYGRQGRWTDLLLGGSNRALADHLAVFLASALPGYQAVTDLEAIPPELRGLHRANPVNVAPTGGVQLELPPRVRGRSPLSPPAGPDGLSAPTRALIDALAAAALAWP